MEEPGIMIVPHGGRGTGEPGEGRTAMCAGRGSAKPV